MRMFQVWRLSTEKEYSGGTLIENRYFTHYRNADKASDQTKLVAQNGVRQVTLLEVAESDGKGPSVLRYYELGPEVEIERDPRPGFV